MELTATAGSGGFDFCVLVIFAIGLPSIIVDQALTAIREFHARWKMRCALAYGRTLIFCHHLLELEQKNERGEQEPSRHRLPPAEQWHNTELHFIRSFE